MQTPLTDAVVDASSVCPDQNEVCETDYRALADHARRLEFELSEAKRAISDAVRSRWINAEERMPEDEKLVLVYLGDHTCPRFEVDRPAYMTACMRSDKWVYNDHVTHWMPLPEAPK